MPPTPVTHTQQIGEWVPAQPVSPFAHDLYPLTLIELLKSRQL
jgi:hypothetical protein